MSVSQSESHLPENSWGVVERRCHLLRWGEEVRVVAIGIYNFFFPNRCPQASVDRLHGYAKKKHSQHTTLSDSPFILGSRDELPILVVVPENTFSALVEKFE